MMVTDGEEEKLLESPDRASSHVDLVFHYNNLRLALTVPRESHPALQSLKDAFLISLLSTPSNDKCNSPVELALTFIGFVDEEDTEHSVLATLLDAFEHQFLRGPMDIHSLVCDETSCPKKRQRWLNAYCRATAVISSDTDNHHRESSSAFLHYVKTRQVRLMAIFGGQGSTSCTCVQELSDMYATYKPLLFPFIRMVGSLLAELSRRPETKSFYQGRHLDIECWLDDSETIPDSKFIASAPVSVPIIGLLSLARYSVVCQVLRLAPGELRNILDATTGHSQGLLVSIAVAMSDSWDSFDENCRLIMEALFWLGWECHQNAPRNVILIPSSNTESQDASLNDPSHMLSICGLEQDQLESILSHLNKTLTENSRVYLALINSRDHHVVAGPVASLMHLQSHLQTLIGPEKDQSRIPFRKRSPSIQHTFLPISTPFHTPYLRGASESLRERFANRGFGPHRLMIPVYNTVTGRDLRDSDHEVNVLDVAFAAIANEVCNWPETLKNGISPRNCQNLVSHMLVFDGGGLGALLTKITEGLGIRLIQAASLDSHDIEMGTMRDLVSPLLLETTSRLQSWKELFQPRLTTGLINGVETRLSRLLGTPPVIVAGMTPTTAHWDVVSAVINAGYHIEMACGAYHNSYDMEASIKRLAAEIPPDRGITCNLIYANPRTMNWQISLLRRLSNNHVPVHGLTIGAGVPSLGVANEYIQTMKLQHISFKPGSIAGIRQVIDIAKAHPDFPIILQWTGGRAGGHHSFEDFHAPILSTYATIRQQMNIYLVAGSGFGNSDTVYSYLSGSWSVSRGYAAMPFDGVLLGSRMMVAQEAHTSPAVKDIIIRTTGAEDQNWDRTYEGQFGGIITVRSEMGEPIHKIATRGVLLWAEMDKTVFNLPRHERLPYLLSHKDAIISRLNKDFAKPWFGRNEGGDPVDLADMTYLEVLRRLVELMYVKHQARWIDPSYVNFTWRFANRALERLGSASVQKGNSSHSAWQKNPHRALDRFLELCPAADDILDPEDVSFFLVETKRAGQKPVNFIPVLNEDFEFYFKKDSLWQSEDIDAVVGQDADRVCILHGPVAAQYSNTALETAKDILDSIVYPLIERLQRELSPADCSFDRDSGLVTPDSWSNVSPTGKGIFTENMSVGSSMTLSDSHESGTAAAAVFSLGSCRSAPAWARAIVGDKQILQGRERRNNPFHQLVQSYPEASVQFNSARSELRIVCEDSRGITSSLEMISRNGVDIEVKVFPPRSFCYLEMFYQFCPDNNTALVKEVMADRNARIRSFYSRLWFDQDVKPDTSTSHKFHGAKIAITHEMIDRYIQAVSPAFPDHREIFMDVNEIPITIGIIIAWEVISRPLVIHSIDGDLLRLVHRSNSFRYLSGATPLRLGDIVTSRSEITAVAVEEKGKSITVEAEIIRSGRPVMVVTSTFLFRGSFEDDETTFSRSNSKWTLHLSSKLDESILLHRDWFHLEANAPCLTGKSLVFAIETRIGRESNGCQDLRVTGTARCQIRGNIWQQVGAVKFQCQDCVGNPVLDFFERRGVTGVQQTEFKTVDPATASSIQVQMPASNQPYAELSKDFNPIHVSPIFAQIAKLPGTLSHGMCTSAVTASALEYLVLEGDRRRLRKFTAKFTGMVFPRDKLTIYLRHTGMIDGQMKISIEVIRQLVGDIVLEAEAEMEQQATAYLFAGQGSQSKGMGMDLYRSSEVARALWDEIDQYLYDSYGWSVLRIVQDNPKSQTIHFRGQRGRKIREKYLSITADVAQPDGKQVQGPVLPGLTPTSESYTFTDPRGLLYSTQFAQPAILLFEAAAFAELRACGCVSHNALYAGHSLGEYGALAALSQGIPLASLVEIAFYRGLMMQGSIASPGRGSIAYGMVAVNPARVGEFFNQTALKVLVNLIASRSQELLEIVNFNVDGEQYVCSGTTTNLFILGQLVDRIAESSNGAELVQEAVDATQDINNAKLQLHTVIGELIDQARDLPGPLELQRGKATIPLPGIDVPFHSSHLRSTVDRFRQCLLKPGFIEGNVDAMELVGRFIPNLIAKPFSLDEAYIREAYDLTQSPVLGKILGVE